MMNDKFYIYLQHLHELSVKQTPVYIVRLREWSGG